ncbi:MAG TPA: hypothetical protein VF263_18660 [Longimicrobiaceae bacterium]
MDELQETIARVKPHADAVVEAATALNAAIRAASDQGLSVRVDVVEEHRDGEDDPVPTVRTRISKRIA